MKIIRCTAHVDTGRKDGRMGKRMASTAAVVALLVAACGGDSATPAPLAPTDVSAETPTPADVSAETPTPDPTEDEAAVIAAWERYLDLSIQARGKAPSTEALEITSYMTPNGAAEFAEVVDASIAGGTYIAGRALSTKPEVVFRSEAEAVVDDCVDTELESRSYSDGSVVATQSELRAIRARAELIAGRWLIAAFETRELCAP